MPGQLIRRFFNLSQTIARRLCLPYVVSKFKEVRPPFPAKPHFFFALFSCGPQAISRCRVNRSGAIRPLLFPKLRRHPL